MAITETDLLGALRDCYDPISRRNLVELQMIRSATLTTDHLAPGAGVRGVPQRYIARVILQARGTDEAANAQLRAQVENRLAGLPWISGTQVELLPPLLPILQTLSGNR